ncbi:MAG: YfhO family protein, partial [Lachnospiraceae bacterium]|nr:YfhO family protein [Lachnospiraceae bacterium]
ALYCNYYIGFIVCLFLVLWFVFYNHHNIKKYFFDGIRFGVFSLVSGGMAAFLLLPAYYGIMSTAAGEMKLPKWEWYGNMFNLLKQQFFLTMPMTNQTFDGGVNLYCGMLAVFTIFLYLFTSRINIYDKIKNFILLAILGISFNSTTLNYIWHGVHDQYGIPNRFSFLFIFILLHIAYDVLKRVKKTHFIFIIAAMLLSVTYLMICSMEADEHLTNKIIIASVIMIIIYFVICLLHSLKVYKKLLFNIFITVTCIVEISISALLGFFYNGYTNYYDKYKSTPKVTAANQRIKEIADEENAGLYRSELMNSIVLDEATWHQMPSVGTFCSTVLGEVTSTMGRLGFYTGANEFLYMGASPFTNSIFNVRYLLKREGDLDNYDYDYVEETEGVGIYENPYPLSIGFSVLDSVKEWNRDAGYPFVNISNLAYFMTGYTGFMRTVSRDYIVSSDTCNIDIIDNKITFTPHSQGEVSYLVSFYANEPGDYYINCRGNNIFKIRFYINGEELAYDRYQTQIFHLGKLSQNDYVSVEYCYNDLDTQTKTAAIDVALFDKGAYKNVYNRLNLNKLKVTDFDDGYIYGSVNIPEGDTLFTSIPYDEGWIVKVDGRNADYYRILDAFIGIDMEAGQHTIEMVYIPKGLYLGMLISFVSWAFFAIIIIYNNNKTKSKNSLKNTNDEIDLETNI